jgi:hypothetical protein
MKMPRQQRNKLARMMVLMACLAFASCRRDKPETTQAAPDASVTSPTPSVQASSAPEATITSPTPIAETSPTVAAATSTPTAPTAAAFLDVNDISYLWPVPLTKADVDSLISLNDEAADGKIFPEPLFAKLIEEAKTVSIKDQARISFPDDAEFKKPGTWKVAGIRVNPSALGSDPVGLGQFGVIPSIRLIVQPVTMDGESAHIHDMAAHVVFLHMKGPLQPDKEAFKALVDDLRAIKAFLAQANVDTTGQELNVHPGFIKKVPGFSDKIRALLKRHLSSRRLAIISFMGIHNGFEPWIFFKVNVKPGGVLDRVPVSGFRPPDAEHPQVREQMLSNRAGLQAEPAPSLDPQISPEGHRISTSLILGSDPSDPQLDKIVLPDATDPLVRQLKFRHVVDFIANPLRRSTANTDCVSCHTETTRRLAIAGPAAPEGIAFKHPAGISKVASSVLPKNNWNVRDFGWGFNFRETPDFVPTVTQRAANEAAESADTINKNPPDGIPPNPSPVPQPVAQRDPAVESSGTR